MRISAGESIRVFPLSNWTELDVWHYIAIENIPIVPLYFAKERPVVQHSGTWIMVDDNRLPSYHRLTGCHCHGGSTLRQPQTAGSRLVRSIFC